MTALMARWNALQALALYLIYTTAFGITLLHILASTWGLYSHMFLLAQLNGGYKNIENDERNRAKGAYDMHPSTAENAKISKKHQC